MNRNCPRVLYTIICPRGWATIWRRPLLKIKAGDRVRAQKLVSGVCTYEGRIQVAVLIFLARGHFFRTPHGRIKVLSNFGPDRPGRSKFDFFGFCMDFVKDKIFKICLTVIFQISKNRYFSNFKRLLFFQFQKTVIFQSL
jgi:hypothetical protein